MIEAGEIAIPTNRGFARTIWDSLHVFKYEYLKCTA